MSSAATIMVVEDNPVTRKMLRIALQSEGYDVVETSDGRSAFAAAEKKMPDLVLQDLVLPDINGFELVRRLRGLPNGDAVPILALSGFTGQLDEGKLAHAGFTAMLIKPLSPSALMESVRTFLPRSRGVMVPVGEGRHVLLVDDDPVQLKLMRIHLRDLGFKVTATTSATEALRAAHKDVPDLIVSDILMPDVDGFQLCFEVRRSPSLARVPVLLLSAYYHDQADQDLARRVGANGLVLRTPSLLEVAAAILEGIKIGAPVLAEEPSDSVKLAHAKAIVRQLERQVGVSSGLARRCTLQAAELCLLGGMADALTRQSEFDIAIRDVLAATLDAAAISKGAIVLKDAVKATLVVRHAIGFSEAEHAALTDFFGETEFLERIVHEKKAISIPSAAVPEAVARSVLDGAGVMFAQVVPLVSQGNGLGAIVLGARRTDVTSEDSVAFARAIGNQIVQSLELETSFKRLAESEQRYRTLMDSANDGIFILAPDGVIREVNRRFEEILGLPKLKIMGRNVRDFVPAAEDRTSPVKIARVDGSTVLMQFSNTAVEFGRERLIFSIARDVTEQVGAQAQLMASDRMASVGMLAAGVAHEINNPLAAVSGNLEIAKAELERLAKRPGAPDNFSELEDVIRDATEGAQRVCDIVRDLKIFSRAEEDRRSSVDVHRVIDSSLRMAWNEIRHRARLVKNYGKLPLILANESRIGQVFLNLIVNAAQALPEGHADTNEIRVSTSVNEADGAVVVEVADTGPGIPPEVLRKLFTPFFSTKPQGVGTGLGLVICQQIVTALGGEITVTSELGKGTVFRVVLPRGAAAEVQAIPTGPTVAQAPRRGRILVVDDEENVAAMIRRTLAPEHEVQVLTSAVQALQRIEAGERFDVILSDVMMPVMTGMDLYSELNKRVPDQAKRMVFLTGGAFTPRARLFLDQVPNARLEKPFELQALRTLTNERVH
jgi:CheY-like chemotaxis protein/signal transduction histidine kinase